MRLGAGVLSARYSVDVGSKNIPHPEVRTPERAIQASSSTNELKKAKPRSIGSASRKDTNNPVDRPPTGESSTALLNSGG